MKKERNRIQVKSGLLRHISHRDVAKVLLYDIMPVYALPALEGIFPHKQVSNL